MTEILSNVKHFQPEFASVQPLIASELAHTVAPGEVYELRIINVGGKKRTDSGYFDNRQALAGCAAPYVGKANIYSTLNPVDPALLARAENRIKEWATDTTQDSHITRRLWLPIDADPIRPSGISSTDEQHVAALERAQRIATWLTAQGWPAVIVADSGNGAHLLCRIDLPNDQAATKLVQRCLQALAALFDDDAVTIDTGNFNAARIWKVYGTIAVKGDNTANRPHRPAYILSAPESIEVVTVEQLEHLAGIIAQAEPNQTGGKHGPGQFDLEAWLATNGLTGAKTDWNGGKRWRLDNCPFSTEHTDGAFLVQLANGAIGAGCKHNSCQGKDWHTLRAMFDGPKPEYKLKFAKKANPVTESKQANPGDWVEQLRQMGPEFKLNRLEDMVEVDGQRLDDVTRSKLYLAMSLHKVPKTYVDDCINVLASENTYHPVQDYLNQQIWDGQNHLEAMLRHIRGDGKFVTYEDGVKAPLHWLLIRRWLLGCVARALDGDKTKAFKHQTPVLVFVGKQGLGKSSWVRWLASGIGYEFHRESPINPHNTDDIRSMVTKWLWEISELGSSLRKGDRDALKGLITQEWHTYRKPWGRASITKPTLCNFVGTINPETGFLDDPTGHRRFLPIHVTDINRAYEKAVDVNQFWAQMVHLYRNGESAELSKLEREALAGVYIEHEVENPLQTYLQMYFTIEPGNTDLKCFTADIILRLQSFGIAVKTDHKVAGRDINDALSPLGLERKLISIGGVKGKGWIGIAPNDRMPPYH